MAGNNMTPPEQAMKETIDWLLALPAEDRQRLEEASAYEYTMMNRAPRGAVAAAPGARSTQSLVLDAGCVDPVEQLHSAKLRPLVMNFAHGYNCGGGFEHSGGSQEEAIFRSSSCVLSLWPHRRADDGPGVLKRNMWIGRYDKALPRKEPFYPHSECGALYSPHVRLVRDMTVRSNPLRPCSAWASTPEFGLVTVAAQDLNREREFNYALLVEKIRTTFYLAALHGHRALVLGAFGCGYFRNPPDAVATAFKELLEGEFAGAFALAVFTIPDAAGARNTTAFEKAFGSRRALKELPDILASLPLEGDVMAIDGPAQRSTEPEAEKNRFESLPFEGDVMPIDGPAQRSTEPEVEKSRYSCCFWGRS